MQLIIKPGKPGLSYGVSEDRKEGGKAVAEGIKPAFGAGAEILYHQPVHLGKQH